MFEGYDTGIRFLNIVINGVLGSFGIGVATAYILVFPYRAVRTATRDNLCDFIYVIFEPLQKCTEIKINH